jgi:hypothetical protein
VDSQKGNKKMTSRQQLYAAGLPLGDSVTRSKLGGGRILGGGGGGSSSSESTNQTTNTDSRVVSGDNSNILNATGNEINNSTINVTDHGAVAGAIDLAKTSVNSNVTVTQAALGTTKEVFADALEGVQDAYSTAKAGDQKIVSIAGLAVIGIAAAALIANRRG